MPPEPLISFADYAARINGLVQEAAVVAIKKTSEEVAVKIEDLYYDFFGELARAVTNAADTPTRFLGNMGEAGAWKPLSESWYYRKIETGGRETQYFYTGLTDHLNKSKKKAAAKARSGGKKTAAVRNKKSFKKFLQEKAGKSRKEVEKFFGPVQVKYYISATGRKTPIKIEQVGNVISQIDRITSHDARGKIITNYNNVSLRSDISMFPALKTAQEFSEWYVVDQMAKQDKSNSFQWMKINSRFGIRKSNRPIRAMITPLISWYATTGLMQIVRKFY